MSRSVRDLPRRLEVPQVTINVLGYTWAPGSPLGAGSYQAPITQLPHDHGYSREGVLRWLDEHCPDFHKIYDLHAVHPSERAIDWEWGSSYQQWLQLLGLTGEA